ncbi:SurA N-terminal domain-containing protein [Bacillus sp. JCM 19034]|uniref:SurA N-terminal domain-containing protein n=1 Tax=Bacillus sp. JCM 19034 TaxID=1481928 RepID=UPI0007821310|nr:SurA N-terminal domain-containing protein [Bacillus sp. JCM 19034]
MKKFVTLAISAGIALTLVACGGDNANEEVDTDAVQNDSGQTFDLGINEEDIPEVIGTVNGQELDRDLFLALLQQEANDLLMQGVELNSDEAKQYMEQAKQTYLEKLVGELIIIQAAEEEGISASDEEVEEEISTYLETIQMEESEMVEILDAQGLSMDDVREDFVDLVIRAKYIDEHITTPEVTEEEIETTYQEWIANVAVQEGEEVPTIDDFREDIKRMLQSQKEQEQLNELIEELIEKSEIERFI